MEKMLHELAEVKAMMKEHEEKQGEEDLEELGDN
jgi:proteasome assembly chaperone (PAC2) family protein